MSNKKYTIPMLFLAAALLLCSCSASANSDDTALSAKSAPNSAPKPLPSFEATLHITAPVPEPEPEPEPIIGPLVPAQAVPVGDEYFEDAAFIGNSLVDGFRMFSGLTNCDFYAAASMTVLGIGDYITQMSSIEYGKIYMLLGINEISYNIDALMKAYSDALDRLMADHPDALVYIMGLSPVSAAKDSSSSVFTMDNIRRFNEYLFQLAEDKNCYYIDLCEALCDESGFLPADVTTDGIHFTAPEYKVWLDYLCLHYIQEKPAEPALLEG